MNLERFGRSRRPARMHWWAIVCMLMALSGAVIAAEEKVNINTATAEQLALLPRVGGVVAQRIVDFREKNGNFQTAEDLLLVAGIGDRTFDLLRPYVAVEGATTLATKVSAQAKQE